MNRRKVGRYLDAHAHKVAKRLGEAMRAWSAKVAKRAARKYAQVAKVDEDVVAAIVEYCRVNGMSVDLVDEITPDMIAAFKAAGVVGLAEVNMLADTSIVAQLDEAALEYASAHAAELITNITATTEERLNGIISNAVELGSTPDELAAAIEDAGSFDEARAMTIARTELADAHVQGNLAGWEASGEVEGKRSILSDSHDEDDICDECAAAGVVGLDEDFVEGYSAPPYHPRCECDIVPVLKGD